MRKNLSRCTNDKDKQKGIRWTHVIIEVWVRKCNSYYFPLLKHIHGEDWGHIIQRGNKDSDLTDTSCQQQTPRRLTVSLPMTKHLRKTHAEEEGLIKHW